MRLPPPWPFRAVWLLLPVLAGPALADALADRSRAVQLVASLLAWGVWSGTLVASVVPRSVTLTVVRIAAPGAVAATAWAAWGADRPVWAATGVAAALAALFAASTPATADAFVDGSSYGNERRLALRVPFTLLLGPIPLAWALVAAAVVAGPLLLAAEQWVAGGVAAVLGVGALVVVTPRLHQLSQRWLVLVPAGIVVHDPLTLADPVLVPRERVARFGPADADAEDRALDLTAGALGLVLELRIADPLAVGLRSGRDTVERADVQALLVSPGRPATTLELAAGHRLSVG